MSIHVISIKKSASALQRFEVLLLWLLLSLYFGPAMASSVKSSEQLEITAPNFPREIEVPKGKIIIYEPQIDSWKGQREIIGWAAVIVKPKGKENKIFPGAIKISAATDTNLEQRYVATYNRKILQTKFSGLTSEQQKTVSDIIYKSFPKSPEVYSLDLVLSYVEKSKQSVEGVIVNNEPPRIFYNSKPSILLMTDGKPLLNSIEKTKLKYIVNTNWTLIFDKNASSYYLQYKNSWLQASSLNGEWRTAQSLPANFNKIPKDDNWKAAHAAIPLQSLKGLAPAVFYSDSPAELIVTDGDPDLLPIKATLLKEITDTDSDLFFHSGDKHFYYLVSGRWFKAKSLQGPWKFSGKLPDDFRKIPAEHAKVHVKASVPGTAEANAALLQAKIPQTATISRKAADIKDIKVIYNGDPEFKPIKGTSLHRAVNTVYDVIRYKDEYYLCYQAAWFVSDSPIEPWRLADKIPTEIYNIPPSSPLYHVTYVKVYDYDDEYVTYGYTSGYNNTYIYHGTVVYGTGYYWPPYYYYYPDYPVYYPYYPSYGVGAYYNPYTGAYGRGAVVYGPYGGFGRGATYNPNTGRYTRGSAAWGPEQSYAARRAYNPRTGIGGVSRQYANDYASWGSSVIRKDDKWAATQRHRTEQGVTRRIETSEGTKGVRVKSEDKDAGLIRKENGDLFVGKDGNVYKKENDQWYQHDGNDWKNLERDTATSQPKRQAEFNDQNLPKKYRDIDRAAKQQNRQQPIEHQEKQSQRSKTSTTTSTKRNQLDRQATQRTYGNTRYNDFSSQYNSGQLYNHNRSSAGRSSRQAPPQTRGSRPSGGGGRRR